MNKIFCFLTGGHKYEDKNLKNTFDDLSHIVTFHNRCIKCGKWYTVRIPEEKLLGGEYGDYLSRFNKER